MTTTELRHVYQPRGTALELMRRKDREILVSGPAGTGKSRACLEKLATIAFSVPGMRGLITRKTMVSLGSTALVTWKQHVIPEALTLGAVIFYGGSPQEPPQYRFSNGSVVAIGGMDKPSRIMSSEYDVVYVQEATELDTDDWEAITTRMRNGQVSYQQLIADCNPSHPTHWLKVRADAGNIALLNATHEENPRYFEDLGPADGDLAEGATVHWGRQYRMTQAGRNYIEGSLDKLTGVRYQRFRKGLWVAADGVIYENFDPARNLINYFKPPDEWARFWTVDFGHTHPFVMQFWAVDPDGRGYLYREIYHSKRLVEDHARDALRAVTKVVKDVVLTDDEEANPVKAIASGARVWTEPRPTRVICDHDAEGRATLEKHLGMGTTAANKTVSAGIQAVESRWRPAGDGKPRLFIMRGITVERDKAQEDAKKPVSTEEEIPGYVWDTGGGRKPKEQPLKENDDGSDALRYFVADQDLTPQVNVRWL